MTALPGVRRVRLGPAVASELRRAILEGRYQPGERLIEDELAARFGVSRVPIREALRTLAAEGLVAPGARRGVRVAALGADLAGELVEVRALLEGMNARLAARRRDPGVLARLRDVLARGDAAAAEAEPRALAALNAEFHELLAEAGSNRVLRDVMRGLRERTELVFRRNTPARAVEDWREHAQILAAVVDGDEELAALLATRHVHQAARARLVASGRDDRARAAGQ